MIEVSRIAKENGNRFENENKFTNAVMQELLWVKKYSTSKIIHSEQQCGKLVFESKYLNFRLIITI